MVSDAGALIYIFLCRKVVQSYDYAAYYFECCFGICCPKILQFIEAFHSQLGIKESLAFTQNTHSQLSVRLTYSFSGPIAACFYEAIKQDKLKMGENSLTMTWNYVS